MTLFTRSFLLIALLILASAAATFQLYRLYEREPRARELAQQTVSIVNLTRSALVNADPVLRRNLLIELNEREGIRLAPLTGGEVLQPACQRPIAAQARPLVMNGTLSRDAARTAAEAAGECLKLLK